MNKRSYQIARTWRLPRSIRIRGKLGKVKNTKQRLTTTPREVTAYHEAGHAVAAIVEGIGIGRRGASIVPDEDSRGSVYLRKGFPGQPDRNAGGAVRLGAERRAIASFAGEAAQRKYRTSSVRRYHSYGDQVHAAELMSYFVESEREKLAYLKWLQIRAEQLVSKPWVWAMIEAVAKALMERDKLSAREAKEIALKANDEWLAKQRRPKTV